MADAEPARLRSAEAQIEAARLEPGEAQIEAARLRSGEAPIEAARLRLAEAQERVLAALVAGADPPAGFDPVRLGVQAASLVAKRRSVVARLRPDAHEASGADYRADFAAYAASRTSPPSGYRADADDFAAWLVSQGKLTPKRRRGLLGRWRRL